MRNMDLNLPGLTILIMLFLCAFPKPCGSLRCTIVEKPEAPGKAQEKKTDSEEDVENLRQDVAKIRDKMEVFTKDFVEHLPPDAPQELKDLPVLAEIIKPIDAPFRKQKRFIIASIGLGLTLADIGVSTYKIIRDNASKGKMALEDAKAIFDRLEPSREPGEEIPQRINVLKTKRIITKYIAEATLARLQKVATALKRLPKND